MASGPTGYNLSVAAELPNPDVRRFRLRLLSQNLWHGLDHTKPFVMWPKEGPVQRFLRTQMQRAGLEELLATRGTDATEELLEVFCLQEVNPLARRMKTFRKDLGMEGVGAPVNVGIKAGPVSYPLFLEDGVGTLWRGPLNDVTSERLILSGAAAELNAPGGLSFVLQLAERRGAVVVRGRWNDKTFVFANLHLHNGPPARPAVARRRTLELESLVAGLDVWAKDADAVFIAGDFNCERTDADLEPIRKAGFNDIVSARGEPVLTWDPVQNPIAKASVEAATDPTEIEWDSRRHQIDHVFYRIKPDSWGVPPGAPPPWTFKVSRALDTPRLGTWISDHFGLLIDIMWTSPV